MADDLVNAAIRAGAEPEGYKEVTVDFFQFKNTGDHVSGTLIQKREITLGSRGNKCGKYTLRQNDGKLISFLGSTQLDDQLSRMPVNSDLWIQFTHVEKLEGSNYDLKHFKVFVKK
jgi:hypothetical protein